MELRTCGLDSVHLLSPVQGSSGHGATFTGSTQTCQLKNIAVVLSGAKMAQATALAVDWSNAPCTCRIPRTLQMFLVCWSNISGVSIVTLRLLTSSDRDINAPVTVTRVVSVT